MNKIRLVHIVHDLGFAGKEQGILKIVSRMDDSRFRVDIIALRRIYREALQNVTLPGEVIELGRKPGNDPALIFKLMKIFKAKRYDIVYTHSWNTLIEGYLAARLCGIPKLIHGEHGTFERSWLKDQLQTKLWSNVDAVTVVADSLRRKMVQWFRYATDNVFVIHNGIDRKRFYPSASFRRQMRERYGVRDKFVVGTVGRFHPVKDHFTLIRAFAQIARHLSHAVLILVGRGELESSYRKLCADLGISDRVLFVPPTSQVEQLYNMFDVFVLSSRSEGCSNVLLEAMACGLPVIATRVGGNPELVEHERSGWLVPAGDVAALAGRMEAVENNPEKAREVGRQALERINSRFTLERTVERYERLYESLVFSGKRAKIHDKNIVQPV